MVTKRHAVAALCALLLLGSTARAQDAALGKRVFEKKGNCASCHGKTGRGSGVAPNLTDSVWLHIDGSPAQITRIVRSGVPKPIKHPAPMPPMGGAKLDDAEITAVAEFVASLRSATASGGPANSDGRCPRHGQPHHHRARHATM